MLSRPEPPAHLLKIAPDEVQPGMYIEELDRPWLDTPLKFQGFRVTNVEKELAWIRNNCAYVVVDADRSDCDALNVIIGQSRSTNGTSARVPARTSSPSKVYSWVERSPGGAESESSHAAPSGAGGKRKWWDWRAREGSRKAPAPKTIIDHQEFRRQVGVAREQYGRATSILANVLEKLRTGGQLDVAAIEHAITPVIDCVLESTDAMACVIRLKEWNEYAYTHALATSIWSVVFGKSLGLDRTSLQQLGKGGVLLDVGMTQVPRELLEKQGALTAEERQAVERHVEYGLQILRKSTGIDAKVLQMVESHHERHDGSGYPLRLSGTRIPLFGRIAGLVDTYDAMVSNRPGVRAQSTFDVMRSLNGAADTLFQAELVDRFIRVVGVFPTASLVELNTGEVGIVIEQNDLRRLRPKVMMVLDTEKKQRSEFPIYDLSSMPADASEPGSVWILNGLEPGSYGVDPREFYL